MFTFWRQTYTPTKFNFVSSKYLCYCFCPAGAYPEEHIPQDKDGDLYKAEVIGAAVVTRPMDFLKVFGEMGVISHSGVL